MRWLKTNNDLILAVGAIIQSLTLLAGLSLAVNELFLNDAKQKRQQIVNTIESSKVSARFVDVQRVIQNLEQRHYDEDIDVYDIEKHKDFDNSVLRIRAIYEPFFQRINILGTNKIIDSSLACKLLFDYADRYYEFIDTYQPFSTMHSEEVGYDLLSTFNFCKLCVESKFYTGKEKEWAIEKYSGTPKGKAFGLP